MTPTPYVAVADRPASDAVHAQAPRPDDRPSDAGVLPLTAALLDVALHGLSFATPGHRTGRSCSGLQ